MFDTYSNLGSITNTIFEILYLEYFLEIFYFFKKKNFLIPIIYLKDVCLSQIPI